MVVLNFPLYWGGNATIEAYASRCGLAFSRCVGISTFEALYQISGNYFLNVSTICIEIWHSNNAYYALAIIINVLCYYVFYLRSLLNVANCSCSSVCYFSLIIAYLSCYDSAIATLYYLYVWNLVIVLP